MLSITVQMVHEALGEIQETANSKCILDCEVLDWDVMQCLVACPSKIAMELVMLQKMCIQILILVEFAPIYRWLCLAGWII